MHLRFFGQQPVAVDDGGGEIDQLAVVGARGSAASRMRLLADRVTLHQDSLGPLDQRTPAERSLQLVVLGEAAQHDVDRALPVLDVVSEM